MKNIYFLLCLLMGMMAQAQIKIGDNPQNIDPSSVLELESSSRVLVITRVNTAQMNTITPSAGALVYNTDIQCIHYYTGTEWKDICDAVAGSITFTSVDGTVVITPNGGNNYDVKVGQITGMNIVNETVFGADIATATIGERQLAPNSVGSSELQDNTVGKDEIQEAAVGTLEIIDGTIQPSDMQPGAIDQLLTTDAAGNVVWLNKNDLGATQADQTTITGAGTAANPIKVADTVIGDILANANNISQNSADIAANTSSINNHIAADGDLSSTNEILTSAVIQGNELVITESNNETRVDLGAFNNTGSDNQNLTLSGNNLSITNANTVNLAGFLDNTDNQNLTSATLSPTNILQINIEDGNPATVDLSSLSGTGTDNQNLTGATLLTGNILQIDIEDGTSATVDLSSLSGTGTDNQQLTITGGNILTLENGGTVDLNPFLDNVDTDDQTLSLSGNEITISEGNTIDLSPILAAGGSDDQQLTLAGNSLTLEDGGAAISLIPYLDNTDEQTISDFTFDDTTNILTLTITGGNTDTADLSALAGGGSTVAADNITITGVGTASDPIKIEPSTVLGQFLRTEPVTGNVIWDNLPSGVGNAVVADELTITGDGESTPLQVITGGITTTQIFDGTIADIDIADQAITLPKLVNGTAAGQLMQWNGTDWVLVADTALTLTETDGIIGNEITDVTNGTLARSGTGTGADPYTLGVADLGVGAAQLANDAVTLPKMAPGTTAGQLMQWNGTDWVLVADTALTLTETDGIIGNEITDVTNGTLARSGTGTGADPYTLGVADLGVGTAQLTDNAVTTIKITDDNVTLAKLANGTAAGQLMQWNGTDWVLIADTALTLTETDGIIGNEVTNVTNGTLIRSGTGTGADPYTLGIADLGVGTAQLANNAVTAIKITDDNVTLAKLANGTAAGQLMQWNGTDWVLVADTALTLTETDGIIGNEVTNVTNGTLVRSGTGTGADPYTLGVADLGVGAAQLANDAVTLPKMAPGTAAGQLLQWDGTDWVYITEADISATAVEVDGIIGNEVTNVTNGTLVRSGTGTGADPYTLGVADLGVGAAQLANDAVTLPKMAPGTAAGQLLQWDGTDWVYITEADISATAVEVDGIIGNEVTDVTNATLERSGAGTNADPYTLGIANLGVGAAQIANDAVTLPKMANGSAAGQLLQWDGTDWVYITEADISATAVEVDGIIGNEVTDVTNATLARSGAGTNADPYTLGIANLGVGAAQIANDAVTLPKMANGSAAGQLLQWDGTDWVYITEADISATAVEVDGIIGNEVTDVTNATLARSGAGTNADPYTLGIANLGVGAAQLADDAVTLPKMANGSAAGQLLQWDGSDWVYITEADISATAVEVDGVIGNEVTNASNGTLLRSGSGTNVDPYTLGIANLGVGAAQIANDAVTLPKMANGTAAGQLLQWDGSDWVYITEADISATAVEVDGIIGNEVTDVTNATLVRSGAGTNADPYTLGIANLGVGAAQIANDAVTLPKMANGSAAGQLLQWDGTDWVYITEADISATAVEVDGVIGNEVTNASNGTLLRSGSGTNVDPYTLGIANLGVGAAQLADDAVTTIKIVDENVTVEKINPSTTNGQVLTTVSGNVQWATPASSSIPAGTSGAIFFSDGSGGLSDNPTNLFWDDSFGGGGALGIGTNNPSNKLHVTGAVRAEGGFRSTFGTLPSSVAYSFDSDSDTGMYRAAANQLGFVTNGAEALRVDASGNVGIGVTNPIRNLHVGGESQFDGDVYVSGLGLVHDVPDYVFQKYFLGNSSLKESYDFQTLAQIEAFVIKHHHLPGIKSAEEVKQNGFWNLSESNLQNLEKIEELFLHTIEQEKKIDQLKTENESLSAELQSLRKDMDEIKALLQKQ
ncbi:hypothetical protein MWU78_21850 [Arenibacter sp. F26102]|uniref:hypothetical protein n=1 Tax=Arenibacter sp. F26102 TaxID=2926416 RepID=UPI001FF5F0F9|nr:hypothetical protein [Arenibacter sp. F26102]MCK0148304.1 hypothetical protein [Arenibacter sp. F26102]